jgi:transcriptional regulator with XRE-family HTH domain
MVYDTVTGMCNSPDIGKILKRLGDEINSEREKRNRQSPGEWTTEKLGKMVGRTQQTISNWENAKVFPQVEKLILLAHILDLSLDEIFFSKPDKRRRPLRMIFEGEPALISQLKAQGAARIGPEKAVSILAKAGIIVRDIDEGNSGSAEILTEKG